MSKNLKIAVRRQKMYYDSGVCRLSYAVGDLVWYMNRTRQRGISPKLQVRWLGGCMVTKKIHYVTYKLHVARNATVILYFDLLKPYCIEVVPL